MTHLVRIWLTLTLSSIFMIRWKHCKIEGCPRFCKDKLQIFRTRLYYQSISFSKIFIITFWHILLFFWYNPNSVTEKLRKRGQWNYLQSFWPPPDLWTLFRRKKDEEIGEHDSECKDGWMWVLLMWQRFNPEFFLLFLGVLRCVRSGIIMSRIFLLLSGRLRSLILFILVQNAFVFTTEPAGNDLQKTGSYD